VIDALIQGRIHGKPASRESANGPYATAKLRTSTRDGEAHFVNVIAFADEVIEGLLALSDGDSIAISGELSPKVWTDREGNARPSLDLLACAVLTPYHVQRKRQAVRDDTETQPA
jgi:single-stranded DNA-binding protein